ncbi:MAG: magnesium/cobalt transporter CorA [Gammaproteobacteria bacterium]|nr:magnesium/cobalt transporter CorA [Gammaproteobacteria bacterium]
MINGYTSEHGKLRPVADLEGEFDRLVWIDLLDPQNGEESLVERAVGINVPTREEMEEIEVSSRLYYEDEAVYMTATLPAQSDTDDPEMAPVTFVLAGERLITVRYHDPRAFQNFPRRAEKMSMGCTNGAGTLIALLEVIVDRLADIVERAAGDIDTLSRGIFRTNGTQTTKSRDFQRALEEIGRKGDLNSKLRDSLATLERLVAFLGQATAKSKLDTQGRSRLKTLSRDVRSLTDHSSFLSQKIMFLLDATLGMINIEQNAIIKIFSVAAVVFLPPTLIASIYGMNFDHMPELDWLVGYPFAIGLMVASAILPYWYFKRRGWL